MSSKHSRYVIGVDLGTTNSCVAFVDTEHPALKGELFSVPQLVSEGVVQHRTTLPSFCYLAKTSEFLRSGLALPWNRDSHECVGTFAKKAGSRVPTRSIASAKSWLCHPGADRRDRILPTEAEVESSRISPVEATAAYLRHIREAWNHQVAKDDASLEFEQQEVVLTVPASFDEVARELTVEAARLADFGNLTLLEEPQAAFYSWISAHSNAWQKELCEGDSIVVVDVGGGTTDFSRIEVVRQGEDLAFQRMAVGDHLLLGGDNMDEALCCYIEAKLDKSNHSPLSREQRHRLLAEARAAKEILLGDGPEQVYPVVIEGSGTKLVGGSVTLDLGRQEVEDLLLGGFFPQLPWDQAIDVTRKGTVRTMGLPYESEPAITKHLAHFLETSDSDKRPDYVLFNGGTMKPEAFRQQCVDAIALWFGEPPKVLSSRSLDHAVARGAAYYGKVRRGLGVRIGGGSARSFYIGVDSDGQQRALTLLARGTEEGTSFVSDQEFQVLPNQPVQFPLYCSHVRVNDKAGDWVAIDEQELQLLSPIQTVLRFGKQKSLERQVPVTLGGAFTELGTLKLWLESEISEHQWNLEFQLRAVSGQEDRLLEKGKQSLGETFDQSFLDSASELVMQTFTANSSSPKEVVNSLEEILGEDRVKWAPGILRGLWDVLLECADKRTITSEHEARWWYLAGFLLRPGTGYPLDDHRITSLWRIWLADGKRSRQQEVDIQRWVCIRRIAPGLNKGQQQQILAELLDFDWDKSARDFVIKDRGQRYPFSERIRAIGALELVGCKFKQQIGTALLKRIKSGEADKAEFWALARIGSRQLLYASAAQAVPAEQCTKWVKELLTVQTVRPELIEGVFTALARKTDHRDLNLPEETIDSIIQRFPAAHGHEQLDQLLSNSINLSKEEEELAFGDHLPLGLSLSYAN